MKGISLYVNLLSISGFSGFRKVLRMKSGSCKLLVISLLLLSCCFLLSVSAEPIHVTYLWHMHQPIYYPYESPQTIDSNGRFNFSVQGVWDGDRVGAYTSWPKDAVQAGADRGMAHAGAQMSYSGSLAENNNNLWGYCTGASWDDAIDWARNGLRTSLNNPRLDTVGIPYHHSLMPLTCKESMIMQIRLHKEQVKELWDTTEYSKGFWPPECAFANNIIPALVEEGLEWVIVDNGHLFRTVPDFPWSDASSCRPNPADVQNPSSSALGSQWVQLQNVWAPTPVLAPWSYQPHNVQYIDPNSGAVQKIIAVPAGRYEGNENGRGGYGAFKPENVWGPHVSSVNTDPNHPMLLLCHSDGDNYGMKNSDAWHGQHEAFLDMCLSNSDFDNTTVQDYLDMYPPDPNDVIHIEPGSWIGIDGGTPYFEKWLSSTYVDGECPDRWSWSVLVAAQNHTILADSLENSYLASGSNMDDVEWGQNNDTARAWHYYLNAETSCYWYWDMDRANPWDGNVTRACNMAIDEANKVIARHSGSDSKGPSIFPPQRDIYNPGGYMWNEEEPLSSDFSVWSFVYDVSGLNSVTLYWRTDLDGVNPISSVQNETYAGGSEVSAWNTASMSASWDPTVKGPDNIVPYPTARAQKYEAGITGQSQVLIDYFVEAVDANSNTTRSDIVHCYVGVYNATNAVPVTFAPTLPEDCEDLITTYNADSRSLDSSGSVTLVISFDDWSSSSEYAMSGSAGGLWRYTNALPAGTTVAKVKFRDGSTYDDNGGDGWQIGVSACAVPPSTAFSPSEPNGCDPILISYTPGDGALASASPVYIHVGNNDWQGVLSPDPAMTNNAGVWQYVYYPPAGAYELNCCFNDGDAIWENDNGADYGVSITDCESTNAAVVFFPGSPTDCDGNVFSTTYNPTNRVLEGESSIYIDVMFDDLSWNRYAMTAENSVWTYENTIPSGTTNVLVQFVNALTSPSITDDNNGALWGVAVSACSTNGPSVVGFTPAAPTGCDDVTITYSANEGVLKDAAQVYIHVGHDNWQDVVTPGPAMTYSNGNWVYTYSLVQGTYEINCCFNDGDSIWDNNNGSDWAVPVVGCTGSVQSIRFQAASPVVTDDPATNQNNYGDAFDFDAGGGFAATTEQGGFGSFGQIFINYDEDYFYIGGYGCDLGASNNSMVIFLSLNTLADNAETLWDLNGAPNGLDYLHNVAFDPAVDLALVLGDEWGDGTYTNFQIADGYDFGQGAYYLSTGTGSFVPVAGAVVSQFDGEGSQATGSVDLDGDRLTDRWEVRIPWTSLNAAQGIDDITDCSLSGLIMNSSVSNNNRYISGNYLGAVAAGTLDEYNNYGFEFVVLGGLSVELPRSDSDRDSLPDEWERRYAASLVTLHAEQDWDQDGTTDLEEYQAGTSPVDFDSCFQCFAPYLDAGSDFIVRWSSVSNRVYEIYTSTNLFTGFVPLDTHVDATPPENVYTNHVVESGVRFYHVVTSAP